jgi:hypothetical protein
VALPIAELISRPKVQVGLAVAVLVVLAFWAFSQVFISPTSRACLELYRHAKTAADTLTVDATIAGSPESRTPEARSCGSIRQSARWF